MLIFTAKVKSNIDFTRTGIVQITCKDEPNIREAIYTSPYYSPYNKGGVFAPPSENSTVLIAYHPETQKAYYLSTVLEEGGRFYDEKFPSPETMLDDEDTYFRTTSIIPNSLDLYEGLAPAAMTFKNNENNGLDIINRNSKMRVVNETKIVNNGKKVSLNSSPEADCVLLDNGHGDCIKINAIPKSAVGLPVEPQRAIQIKSEMGQEYVTNRGGIDIRIVDGKDITIENGSTGWWALAGLLKLGIGKSGNVNIFSKYRTVRLGAKGTLIGPTVPVGGSILLETSRSNILITDAAITITNGVGAVIELNNSTGQINLISPSGINIQTTQLSINAISAINLNSPTINLGGSSTNLINVYSRSIVNIDGSTALNLNTNTARAAITSVPTLNSLNLLELAYLKTEYPTGSKYPV